MSKSLKTSSRLGPNPADPLKTSYIAVCTRAEELFSQVRQNVVVQTVPATLKSALLDPVSERLAAELSANMFACKDDEFMAFFTGGQESATSVITARRIPGRICSQLGCLVAAQGATDALAARREMLSRRLDGLLE